MSYISYLDESKVEHRGPIRYYTIASMTASKEDYVQDIEVKWKAHRDNYNIPQGQDIHFTDIKHLLNPATTNRPHKPDCLALFSNAAGGVDYTKLHEFYSDTLQIIQQASFIIQLTGIKWDANHFCRRNNLKDKIYFPPFITFREHLDIMGLYLLGVHNAPYDSRNGKITKLRYDGDVGLQERDDIKRAYHQTMTVGTRHFKAETAIKLFDEVRFIGKGEIGYDGISHAGSEIIDFITTIAARDMWQIDTNMIPLNVPTIGAIDPLPVIKPKILHAQKIKDFYY